MKLPLSVTYYTALKFVTTILLLFVLGGMLCSFAYPSFIDSKPAKMLTDKDADELKKEEKKEDKMMTGNILPTDVLVIIKKVFTTLHILVKSSPAIDHHTPPPDNLTGMLYS